MTTEYRTETADLSTDEIIAATEGALEFARERFGGTVDAKTVDLRLWAAAALINSAINVSVKPAIMRSLDDKLAMMNRIRTN